MSAPAPHPVTEHRLGQSTEPMTNIERLAKAVLCNCNDENARRYRVHGAVDTYWTWACLYHGVRYQVLGKTGPMSSDEFDAYVAEHQ